MLRFKVTIHFTSDSTNLIITTDYRVGQIRVIFSLPSRVQNALFPPNVMPYKHLAYIDWFTKFPENPDSHHLMYKIFPLLRQSERIASIVPLSRILCSIHLFPKFGPIASRDWSSSNVLELCKTFFVNPYSERYVFLTLH
jgi:hypothetical protein